VAWHRIPLGPWRLCFSPLREGDTSVAVPRLPTIPRCSCFSPLREGDTSVATGRVLHATSWNGFSPLREGDTSVAQGSVLLQAHVLFVSVPFARGTPPWRSGSPKSGCCKMVSVPFARGTPPWHASFAPLPCVSSVSVPFARGTPPWHGKKVRDGFTRYLFQSPSRGGHLRGFGALSFGSFVGCFSPLREGDTSVARNNRTTTRHGILVSVPFARGTPPWLQERAGTEQEAARFSPLREGDTSVALMSPRTLSFSSSFSPLREGDTSVAPR